MKKLFIILFCLIAYAQIEDKAAFALAAYFGDVGPPRENEVHIGKTVVFMPLGRIMLVRKNQDYCAIKFTKWWSENPSSKPSMFVATGTDEYAVYESYCLKNKTGGFFENNIQVRKEKLSLTKPRGIGRLAFSFGNSKVECGNIRLGWYGGGLVNYSEEVQNKRNYDTELAPTPWSDVKEVNVLDQRIKWFRYDESRKRVNIPIDNIWEK